MKIDILTSLLAILMAQSACAFEVVYPKNTEVEIKSPQTFFVGNSNPKKELRINGELVNIHPSGGFVHIVKLENGINEFVIEEGHKHQTYKITNPEQNFEQQELIVTDFESPKIFMTVKDNVPLRSTPIDGGINRIAHFQKGIPLKAVGKKGEFYKIELNNEKTAWISTKDVESFEIYNPVKLLNKTTIPDNDFYIFKFNFDNKTPYIIEGGYPFTVKFYNIEGEENNTLTFSFPLTQKLLGYSGQFEDNSFILKIRKAPKINDEKPLKDIKIVIDAGHGGAEIGTIGCLKHLEKDINIAIAKQLEKELKSRGAKVIMTRKHDEQVELYRRVEITNENDATIFISIHGNALPDNMNPIENNGTSIYYYYPQAKPLADAIMKEMNDQLPLNDDKVRKGSLAVVRNTNALSVLIEVGYLINPDDNEKLIDKEIQKQSAKAIADGIEEFFKN